MQLQHPIYNVNIGPIHISQYFGPTSFGDYGQFNLIGHNGWDYACPEGTPIHAAHDGWIVEATSKTGGFGIRSTLVFEDAGQWYMTIYGHEKSYVGQQLTYNFFDRSHPVKQGDIIGYVNSTGYSFGNHVHFGLYKYNPDGSTINKNNGYGGAVDPRPYLPTKFPTDGDTGVVMSQLSLAIIHGRGGIFIEAATTAELVTLGKQFGKEVKLADDGVTVLNPDIQVVP